ncbi:MAG: prenyltransferase [Candidatus Omnitrophica bacterium]|nr:prenyltransferase [Candidatus Omnitrophota bacterium]
MDRIISLIRYRFFLFAGIFPYLLGQAIAFSFRKSLNWHYFCLGFLGIFLVLIGVEMFNEYFDAKEGGDRIFLEEKPEVPDYFFILGILVFMLAFFIGVYLTFQIGWPILLFSFLGFLGAYFYVGPPIRWAYRGLGELVIALSYGPFMVLGSYYLQTKRIDVLPLWICLILGLLIFSLGIANEIPDYYQDKLVGKRNLVVRLGRKNAVKLFSFILFLVFLVLSLGIWLGVFPFLTIACFLLLPLALRSIIIARTHYDSPLDFLPAIRITLFIYIIIVGFLSISCWGGQR